MVNLHDFVSNSDLFKKFRADDVLFVEYTCLTSDVQSDIWSHLNYFAYVLGGRKMWKTPKSEYLATSGDLLFVKKGATNVYQYFEEKFFVLFIFVSDDFIRSVIKRNGMKRSKGVKETDADSDTVIPLRVDQICASYFQSLLHYFSEPAPPSEALLRTRFEELILSELTREKNRDLVTYFHSLNKGGNASLKEIMETHFHQHLTLNDYARLCARSLSAFKRDFETVYGTPPGKWLSEKRLLYSKYLLETTNEDLQEVMQQCGFINMSHFIRAFKNKFSVTPYQFKKAEYSF